MRHLVDANLMVLLVVGLTRREAIGRHRRLRAYTANDFERLLALLSSGSGLVISAYVMAEASNLAVYGVSEPLRSEIRGMIKLLIDANIERHVACATAAERPEFRRLGLADAALLELRGADCKLVTADAELAAAAWSTGDAPIYFGPPSAVI